MAVRFNEGLLHLQRLFRRGDGLDGHRRCDTSIAKFQPSRPVRERTASLPPSHHPHTASPIGRGDRRRSSSPTNSM